MRKPQQPRTLIPALKTPRLRWRPPTRAWWITTHWKTPSVTVTAVTTPRHRPASIKTSAAKFTKVGKPWTPARSSILDNSEHYFFDNAMFRTYARTASLTVARPSPCCPQESVSSILARVLRGKL